MYNGIGLETARGSGTNGFVQRNLSFVRRHKDKVDYKSEEELKKIEAQMTKGPNKDILDHERKRKVELKCMEMQELMEEQGYNDDEIERKVSMFRQMLMEKIQETIEDVVEKDEAGRPIAKATHQIAEANQARNEQLKAAFGLSEYYKDGTSMDPQRKAKEDAAKALAMAQKKYTILPDEDDADQSQSQSSSKKSKHKEKPVETEPGEKKKKRRHDSSSSPTPERRKSRKTETNEQPRDKVKEREREKEKEKAREGKHRRERSRSSSVPRKKKRSSRSRSCSEENPRKKQTRASPPASKDKRSNGKSRR